MRHRAPVLGLLLMLGLAEAGCHHEKTPLQRGAGTYARICASCHGPLGTGLQITGLDPPPRDLTDPKFQDEKTDAELKQVLKQGKGQMPAFGQLFPEQELDEVILYVRTLRKR